LHATLAEGLGTHERRAVVVLKRAAEDLARGCGVLVDEQDERHVIRRHEPVGAHLLLGLVALLDPHDDAVIYEQGCDVDRLLQESTGIVSNIENERLCALLLQVFDRLLELFLTLRVEAAQGDVADILVVAHEFRHHVGDVDLGALDREGVLLVVLGGARNCELDLGALGSAHGLDDRLARPRIHAIAVDLHDDVVGFEAGLLGRCALDDRDEKDGVVLLADGHADAVELAVRLLVEQRVVLRIEVRRVLVPIGLNQSVDRTSRGRGHVSRVERHLLEQPIDLIDPDTDRFAR